MFTCNRACRSWGAGRRASRRGSRPHCGQLCGPGSQSGRVSAGRRAGPGEPRTPSIRAQSPSLRAWRGHAGAHGARGGRGARRRSSNLKKKSPCCGVVVLSWSPPPPPPVLSPRRRPPTRFTFVRATLPKASPGPRPEAGAPPPPRPPPAQGSFWPENRPNKELLFIILSFCYLEDFKMFKKSSRMFHLAGASLVPPSFPG